MDQDRGFVFIESRVAKMRAIWHSMCSFLMEPAPQLKRACIESGLYMLSVDPGPLALPEDLFSNISPSLRVLKLEDALLPVQPALALNRIQDFSYHCTQGQIWFEYRQRITRADTIPLEYRRHNAMGCIMRAILEVRPPYLCNTRPILSLRYGCDTRTIFQYRNV